jgi:hypothetical protein
MLCCPALVVTRRSLCYKEPQITEEDKDWDGTWEGGSAAADGMPSLAGLAQSGYDSDVEEQLQTLPPQQRQQQQQATKPKQQQQQPPKPKMSTGGFVVLRMTRVWLF